VWSTGGKKIIFFDHLEKIPMVLSKMIEKGRFSLMNSTGHRVTKDHAIKEILIIVILMNVSETIFPLD